MHINMTRKTKYVSKNEHGGPRSVCTTRRLYRFVMEPDPSLRTHKVILFPFLFR